MLTYCKTNLSAAMVPCRDLFGSQIPVTTRGFELRTSFIRSIWPNGLGNYIVCSSNPPVVTGICDPNKSRAQHHCSFKFSSKLKYLNRSTFYGNMFKVNNRTLEKSVNLRI